MLWRGKNITIKLPLCLMTKAHFSNTPFRKYSSLHIPSITETTTVKKK